MLRHIVAHQALPYRMPTKPQEDPDAWSVMVEHIFGALDTASRLYGNERKHQTKRTVFYTDLRYVFYVHPCGGQRPKRIRKSSTGLGVYLEVYGSTSSVCLLRRPAGLTPYLKLGGCASGLLTPADMDWAMQQMERYRLSHGVGMNDCLIASVAHRLQVPMYTHNLKDMRVLLNEALVVKPY